MTTDSDIELSGAFQARDSSGRTLDVKAIRIFDEGYGIIDVYVEFAKKLEPGAYKDTVLVRQIIDRLRAVGYKGPDFGHSDPGLQESRLIQPLMKRSICPRRLARERTKNSTP